MSGCLTDNALMRSPLAATLCKNMREYGHDLLTAANTPLPSIAKRVCCAERSAMRRAQAWIQLARSNFRDFTMPRMGGNDLGELFTTWIGGGVAGTIALLAGSLRTGGIILIGEPYWLRLPPTEDVAKRCHAGSISDFLMLPKRLASFGDLDCDVVEMVLADQDSWDRSEAAKWLTMRRWLETNPGDGFAKDVRAALTSVPERYAAYTREYLGWAVFALMAR